MTIAGVAFIGEFLAYLFLTCDPLQKKGKPDRRGNLFQTIPAKSSWDTLAVSFIPHPP